MKLNHVLVRTTDLNAMSCFLIEVVDLEQGKRPPFPFRGAWFYSNGQPLVHVVEDRSTQAQGRIHCAPRTRGRQRRDWLVHKIEKGTPARRLAARKAAGVPVRESGRVTQRQAPGRTSRSRRRELG